MCGHAWLRGLPIQGAPEATLFCISLKARQSHGGTAIDCFKRSHRDTYILLTARLASVSVKVSRTCYSTGPARSCALTGSLGRASLLAALCSCFFFFFSSRFFVSSRSLTGSFLFYFLWVFVSFLGFIIFLFFFGFLLFFLVSSWVFKVFFRYCVLEYFFLLFLSSNSSVFTAFLQGVFVHTCLHFQANFYILCYIRNICIHVLHF